MNDYEKQIGQEKARLIADQQSAGCNAQKAQGSIGGYYRPSPREEAAKAAQHHAEQYQKCSEGASFLAAHPEFEEFIRLVRSGSLQF